MPGTPLTNLRGNRDFKSAALAFCCLFLIVTVIGAFASAAVAGPVDDAWDAVHCLDVDGDDEDEDDGAPPSCCTLGCPMVSNALPGPAGASLPLRVGEDGVAAPPPASGPLQSNLAAATGARGPPASEQAA